VSNNTTIDLVVPGLFGSLPLIGRGDYPDLFPRLESLSTRASVLSTETRDFSRTLFHLFGIPILTTESIPVAPFSRVADGGEVDGQYWMLAAPVHLRADRTRLVLFDSVDLEFSDAEASELAGLFKEHFQQQGWRLEMLSPSRWYLGLEDTPQMTTSHLDEVMGRSIDSFLPQGQDAGHWHRILNEVQMLFHNADVNRKREERGVAPVNSLWFYGGGRYIAPGSCRYEAVGTDSSLARGLAMACGVAVGNPCRDSLEDLLGADRILLANESLRRTVLIGDSERWLEEMSCLERLFGKLEHKFKSGALSMLNIYTCDGSIYQIDKRRFEGFWKRTWSFLSARNNR
jgi:hypothetical protein